MATYDYEYCGKYYDRILWLLIPNIFGGIFTKIGENGSAALVIIGTLIQLASSVAYIYFLSKLSDENESYRTAWILMAIATVISTATGFIKTSSRTPGLSVILGLAGAALAVAELYYEFSAHSDVMAGPSGELSRRWLTLRKWYTAAYIVLAASLILVWGMPVFAGMLALIAGVATIVLHIMSLVSLYRSAEACKTYAAFLEHNGASVKTDL